jgi:hypothetical protein
MPVPAASPVPKSRVLVISTSPSDSPAVAVRVLSDPLAGAPVEPPTSGPASGPVNRLA